MPVVTLVSTRQPRFMWCDMPWSELFAVEKLKFCRLKPWAIIRTYYARGVGPEEPAPSDDPADAGVGMPSAGRSVIGARVTIAQAISLQLDR